MKRCSSTAFVAALLFAAAAGAQSQIMYSVTDLGTLGGPFTSSVATGINNRGEVVGYSSYVVSPPSGILTPVIQFNEGFVYDGAMHDLGLQFGIASGVNDRGQILASTLGGAALVDVKNNGSVGVTPLIDPQSQRVISWGASVNNAGEVAGNGFGA